VGDDSPEDPVITVPEGYWPLYRQIGEHRAELELERRDCECALCLVGYRALDGAEDQPALLVALERLKRAADFLDRPISGGADVDEMALRPGLTRGSRTWSAAEPGMWLDGCLGDVRGPTVDVVRAPAPPGS
jgi:hypothetical protein